MTGRELFDELGRRCKGAVFVSETDSAVEPVFVPAWTRVSSAAEVARLLKLARRRPAEFVSLDDLERKLTTVHDWYTADERRNVGRFEKIFRLMRNELDELQVVRAGRVQIAIAVYGHHADGNIYGIKMSAVET